MREEHELNQNKAPIYEALQKFRQMRVVPFDVPGHKRGRGNPELTEFLGERCISIDVNSMKPLDNLCHPISVIREAEQMLLVQHTHFLWSEVPQAPCRRWCFRSVREEIRSFFREMYIAV